jgi:enamine deaminase RidA (YjgF/YER057c/UK114 family)
MTNRKLIPAGTKFEDVYGYSRAIGIKGIIMVSGTTALDAKGRIVGKDDMYAQTVVAIRKVEAALDQLGATLSDVVRTRVYTRDISRWREIARAHREFFGAVKPTSTLVEVQKLIEPEALVEIEVEAIVEK